MTACSSFLISFMLFFISTAVFVAGAHVYQAYNLDTDQDAYLIIFSIQLCL